jgi:hypothetical protein
MCKDDGREAVVNFIAHNGIGLCEARHRQMTVLALPLIGGFCIARVMCLV